MQHNIYVRLDYAGLEGVTGPSAGAFNVLPHSFVSETLDRRQLILDRNHPPQKLVTGSYIRC